jgi:hypothetical protein
VKFRDTMEAEQYSNGQYSNGQYSNGQYSNGQYSSGPYSNGPDISKAESGMPTANPVAADSQPAYPHETMAPWAWKVTIVVCLMMCFMTGERDENSPD